ncbi:aminopeptidase N [Mobilicoccus pelagius]|uniref:Aminopeptidase N n=1 Tax=Mobilicoccus pelagius NBRC 104925 TaxID=1089455 RepID=H5UVD0_9MICO|nr:aminopeptidase N [Mobilicoccus pelagius]GAB49688.1 aminopeptidase N [Mobilicoccus pelagius NBRC 104925]
MPGENLTREEARARAALLTVDSHRVDLDVSRAVDEPTFPVTSTIVFECREPGASTFLDFIGPSVEEIVLNGHSLDPATHVADSRITLPDLAEHNELVVRATGRYMNTGEGLHRFTDPVDGETYLYTQFEVPDSRRAFPVFEQPDLKTRFTFVVTAPADWAVVSCQPTPQPKPACDGVATWAFAPTPPLSSYVTAIVAGPYERVEDVTVTGDGREVPLGLYCRRTMREFLDADELFAITKSGFDFYEKEFGLAYPFEKYDQVFTPEFNAGAMENVGCVTFRESYLFRSKVSEAVVERRAGTILHELAHMWFGNLVTMRWWDDLWLNESFADWAATTSTAEATHWTEAWTTFATSDKSWAYQQDQLSSTHPIAADMRDLEDVAVNFDGITYAKGASVLKQLVAYVGRQPFRDGIRAYFAKHAYGNTSLPDLLVELEATSGRDLGEWTRLWLQTAGVGTARLALATDDEGVVTAAHVEQTATEDHPHLRPHRMAIGIYDVAADGTSLERRDRIEIDVDGARTEAPELVGVRRGNLMLLNDDDLAYVKVRLDDVSLRTVLDHAAGLPGLPRAIVQTALWDMTRDTEITAHDFVRFTLDVLGADLDATSLRYSLARLGTAAHLYSDPTRRKELRLEVADRLRQHALDAAPGSDAQLQLVSTYATFASTDAQLDEIAAWLEGRDVPDGLAVDTEMRWTLLSSLAAGGRADAAAIEDERRRDATATGRERAALALAARPTPEAKDEAWAAAVDDDTLPNAMIDATATGFLRCGAHPELLEPFVARYHDALRSVWEHRTQAIGESIVEGFYPVLLADERLLQATQSWLDANTDAPQGLVRLVGEQRDAVARALRAQARDAKA